jgi:HSP20 family protein
MLGLTRGKGTAPLARAPRPEIGRYDPWTELNRFRGEIDPFFRAFFGPPFRAMEESGVFTPPVDLYETAEELVLHVYLPRLSREDVHLEVEGDTIHLWGETKPTVPEKEVTIHLAQGGYGAFDLRYRLPVEVQTEKCAATYRNGILEVRLPKVEAARPRKVEIRVEG